MEKSIYEESINLEKVSDEVLLLLYKDVFLSYFNNDEFDSDKFFAIEKEILRRMKKEI